mmetsp:Transcript_56015/g.131929  ORF Transcript_56015/g.131929 Transcript_56015/m.131929 type:complete len:176 (+) Transcript_56015:220-747(+)
MPSPLHQFPFVGKRTFSMSEEPDLPCAKRARSGASGQPLNHFNAENMAPMWQGDQAMGWQGDTAMCQQPNMHCGQQQQQQQQQQQMPNQFQCMQTDTERAVPMDDEQMQLEGNGVWTSRFERFPQNRSPTHWHSTTAVPATGIGTFVLETANVMPAEEQSVRTWECSYGGRSDYY